MISAPQRDDSAAPIRAFIAVRIAPSHALRRILTRLSQVGRAVHCVQPDNLHLTLRFLGDIDPVLVAPIGEALRHAAAGIAPLHAHLQGLGTFPHLDRPRVVWIALHHIEPLEQLTKSLDPQLDALRPALLPRDRPWLSHLTLARVKFRPPPALRELIDDAAQEECGTQTLSAIHLVRSRLTPQGPIYDDLVTVPFA